VAACGLGLAGYAVLSWQYVLWFFLPTFYLGWCLAHLENYYEHFGASSETRSANSVSYYGRLYNLLFCNEGYHQEHHLRPQWHWTRRPELRAEFPEGGRLVSKFPPLLAFLDRR
jgi:fatty acid desaturase